MAETLHHMLGTGATPGFGPADMDTIRDHRGWFFALGIAFMLLGALAIFLPFVAALVTTVVLGWLMIVGGLFQGFHAVQNRRWASSAWGIVAAILQVLAGALIVAFPITGTLTLTLVLAAFFVANGVVKMIRAIQHRTMPRWGWLLVDGVLSLVLGAMIALQWPAAAAWALGLIVGIDFIMGGASMLVIGLGARPLVRSNTATA
mgnify:CR=1 FL=1